MATTDEVRLTVPAMPEFLRLTRVTAAGLASRLGFSFDEVEDLRLAIDELCYGLTGSTGRPGTMHVRYVLGPGTLLVEGEGRFDPTGPTGENSDGGNPDGKGPGGGATASGGPGGGDAPPIGLSELSEVILTALVDEHELGTGDHGPTFRLLKRHRGGGDE